MRPRPTQEPQPGDQVTIDAGRWRGRQGTLLRYDVIASGQTRCYPVVRLPDGPTVRVVTVTPVPTST